MSKIKIEGLNLLQAIMLCMLNTLGKGV